MGCTNVAVKNNEPNETPQHVEASIEVDAANGIDPFKVGMCSTIESHDPRNTMKCDKSCECIGHGNGVCMPESSKDTPVSQQVQWNDIIDRADQETKADASLQPMPGCSNKCGNASH